jgi:hypothetical protein
MQVFICTKDKESPRAIALSKLFPNYDVFFYIERAYNNLTNLQNVLKSIPENTNILFLKEDSVTISDATGLEDVIEHALDRKWDLYYLCKWLDHCELYEKYEKLNDLYVSVRTYMPQGLQAIMVSPFGISKILSLKSEAELLQMIKDNKLKAFTCIPNVFEVDLSSRESDADIVKRFPCQSVFPGVPVIKSYVQTQTKEKPDLLAPYKEAGWIDTTKVERENRATVRQTPVKPTEGVFGTSEIGWMDSISYDDLGKLFIIVFILTLAVGIFRGK